MSWRDEVTFAINGKIYKVNNRQVEPETSLIAFIRDQALLKGTKYMCREGTCGACLVTMQFTHPVTKKDQTCAINSCLMPVLACHGVSIITVEGVGSKKTGYHKIQTSLASSNGTQCGYCSPGMVMNMYSLMKSNPQCTPEQIERSFGGQICRCTGYRPILQAFKALTNGNSRGSSSNNNEASSKDSPIAPENDDNNQCGTKCCKEGPCGISMCGQDAVLNFAELALAPKSIKIEFTGINTKWYKVTTVFEVLQVLDLIGESSYMLMAGNTSRGLYPIVPPPTVYIDVRNVKELQQYWKCENRLVVGGNMTLTDAMAVLKKVSLEDPIMFGYTNAIADHIEQTANVAVRNVATIAGNLSMKHSHREFSSDIFCILETIGAKLRINEIQGTIRTVTLEDFLKINMDKKVITAIELPAISSNHYVIKTYKVMPKRQNSLALMSAGFLFRMLNDDCKVEEEPKIIFTNIDKDLGHCPNAESVFIGKSIWDPELLTRAMDALYSEIQPAHNPMKPSPEYRRKLACSLLYRFMLSTGKQKVKDSVRSGGDELERTLSTALQDFAFSEKYAPAGHPLQKLEALSQTAGEAEYVDDIPKFPNEHFAAFVLAEEAGATIHSVDPSAALGESDIVAYFGADDIPGINSFGGIQPYLPEHEEVFCTRTVQYSGQPVGILVGKSQESVTKAVRRVVINYMDKGEPLLTIRDVLLKQDSSRIIIQNKLAPTETKGNIKYEMQGELELGCQYHYTMELPACLAVPTDFGLKVYPTSQWIQSIQSAVAQTLGIPENSIEVEVKRIGGGFGSKMTRTGQLAAACCLAAYKLNMPVRMVLDFATNMKCLGKRCPVLTKYQVSVDESGVIQKLTADLYEDYGVSLNDPLEEEAMRGFQNCYDFKTWSVNVYAVKTDNIRTYARGPGTLEGTASIEHIMDHIAEVTGKDPVEVRLANTLNEDLTTIQEIVSSIKTSSDYSKRCEVIRGYNKDNRWKKRGISLIPIKFMICFAPSYYGSVSVFPGDGSVSITTGGIEMGQGINTKAAQVCAYALGIELEKVNVMSSRGITSPGNFPSGSSITSDSVCSAVLSCCEELKNRFEPLKKKLENASWVDLVRTANLEGLSLISNHTFSPTDEYPKDYPVYGAAVLEVELDALTGQYQILRADILEDAGDSLNPLIDVGQIEGGFVMGLGYFSSENLICDDKTGAALCCSSSDYWPPGATDIPADFRVTLRKNAPNPLGVLRSKATGEPPLCMSCVLPSALRRAIAAVRSDAGVNDKVEYAQPFSFERTLLACGTDPKYFTM
ncbi:hypothetical protein GE061_012334 [Apolygus lucorum]|uniref:FAD-binding PCMH-type domain-containing protein n=1 Tax=Apolygus lucorum TaxID=248454 RepID=A0A8S9XTD6_APOLU|nr:hypothetical protein GE061_012334 [Apolygus lucorum]